MEEPKIYATYPGHPVTAENFNAAAQAIVDLVAEVNRLSAELAELRAAKPAGRGSKTA